MLIDSLRWPLLLTGALMWAAAIFAAPQAACSTELPTRWEAPPGEPLEHMTAGYAENSVLGSVRDRPGPGHREG